MRATIDRIQGLWCEVMHERAMWPIHGKYRCATCLREYAVGFAGAAESAATPAALPAWPTGAPSFDLRGPRG